MPSSPIYVLFGATGDLATRKILPSLYLGLQQGTVPSDFSIIASSRRDWDDSQYRSFLQPFLKGPKETVENFLSRIRYQKIVFGDPAGYRELKSKIPSSAIYHLSIEPKFYDHTAEDLANASLIGTLLVEKPFGEDLASAEALERTLEQYFPPENILRIDHYMAKDGLRNFVELRKKEGLEERLSNQYISSISCRLLESIGIEGRGEFYDSVGALRDVGQNHLLTMLATVMMDPATNSRADALEHLLPINSPDAVFGQYAGYAEEPDIAPNSTTETFFRVVLHSNDPRWTGVSLILEAGKSVAEKKNEIVITFKDRSQKSISLTTPQVGEYALLLRAALTGDSSLFISLPEVLASWKVLEPLLTHPPLPKSYPKGSSGPTVQGFRETQ